MSGTRGKPSAELRLVAACCRWPTDVAAIQAAASAPIDWSAAVRLSRRHRVIGFLRQGLVAAGIAVPPRLDQLYAPMMRRNILQYGEAVRLTALLADAGIPVALLKGVVLAELAYGGPGVKQTIDNDLLVAPRDVPATIAILRRAGYREIGLPDNDNPPPPAQVIDLVSEYQLIHPASGAILDLHWRLHAYKQVLGEPDVATDVREIMVEGNKLPTLRADDMMLYLAIHGTRHSWARIKWLADYNAMLGRMDDREVAALRALARRGGVAPCVDAALIQCERLFGTRVPADVHRSRRARLLVRLSDAVMFGPDQHNARGLYARRWLASTLVMNTRLGTAGSIFWHLWVSPIDTLTVPLPRPLHPLYLAISPARRIGRIMRRAATRGFARVRSGPMRAAQEK
ncbi:nucleotidyltransferase family protein [Sphingomonas bacterium]|uniref:nucleotidyltransferase domain-containing protein n=1 Tax=Sphingomonas bacterium TaxID=1895847 RepID=UPI002611B5BB|nr:nucleotidyltransferase family protein [Sphingomonas bacterium]MDB5677669.1 hypothetical protein [Sphingomonas bacterium]